MLRSISVILLVAFSASVSAQGLDYNYLQASYGRVDLDVAGLDVDGDGFGISGSFSVGDNFHLFGEYQTADMGSGVDLSFLELGGGYHTDISPNMDVYANIGYIEIEVDSPGPGSADEDGFFVGLGLRGAVSEAVELFGGIDYIDFDDADSETRANAGFVLDLTDKFSVGLKASFWDDVDIYQLNARFYFE